MLIGQIEGATRTIGESQGYEGLPVRDGLVNCTVNGPRAPAMTTAWRPTREELRALNAGASIHVTLLGRDHPPIMVEAGPVPGLGPETRLHGGTIAYELLASLRAEVDRLRELINSPVTDNWIEGVKIEAAHQQEYRAEHDLGKTHPDWFWLVGFLAGKALFAATQGDKEKAKHHTISTGAALLNWWRHIKEGP